MLFLAPGRTGKLSDTGTGAERMEGGLDEWEACKGNGEIAGFFWGVGGVGQSVPT